MEMKTYLELCALVGEEVAKQFRDTVDETQRAIIESGMVTRQAKPPTATKAPPTGKVYQILLESEMPAWTPRGEVIRVTHRPTAFGAATRRKGEPLPKVAGELKQALVRAQPIADKRPAAPTPPTQEEIDAGQPVTVNGVPARKVVRFSPQSGRFETSFVIDASQIAAQSLANMGGAKRRHAPAGAQVVSGGETSQSKDGSGKL